LSEYTGTYTSEELNADYVLRVAGEKLVIDAGGTSSQSMAAEFADGFSTTGGATVWFRRDKHDRVVGFTLSTGRANGLLFARASPTKRNR
jgi:hypothetical protein